MYSDTINDNAEHWFTGSIIYEMNLDTFAFDPKGDSELISMNKIVLKLFNSYKKLTVVNNYNEQALTMACLTGHYRIFKLNHKDDYMKLSRFDRAMDYCFETHTILVRSNALSNETIRLLDEKNAPATTPILKEIEDTTKKYIDQQYSIIEAFKADFNNNFSASLNN
jgi:hypothetical protein